MPPNFNGFLCVISDVAQASQKEMADLEVMRSEAQKAKERRKNEMRHMENLVNDVKKEEDKVRDREAR